MSLFSSVGSVIDPHVRNEKISIVVMLIHHFQISEDGRQMLPLLFEEIEQIQQGRLTGTEVSPLLCVPSFHQVQCHPKYSGGQTCVSISQINVGCTEHPPHVAEEYRTPAAPLGLAPLGWPQQTRELLLRGFAGLLCRRKTTCTQKEKKITRIRSPKKQLPGTKDHRAHRSRLF